MELSTAINVLSKYGEIYSSDYSWREFALELEPSKSEWLDYRSGCNFYDAPVFDSGDSITFDTCLDTTIEAENGKILLTIVVWRGDNWDGCRDNQRCYFEFLLDTVPLKVEEEIRKHLLKSAKRIIEQEDEEEYNRRILLKREQLLNECGT